MFSNSSRCSECGYGPIGPFTDNCPICAGPVQSGGGAGSVLQSIKANVWVGWLVILGVSFYFHGGNWGPLLFMAAPAGAAWWFIMQDDSKLLVRVLGGVYLGLLVLGIGVASQPGLLPGLGNRSFQIEDMIDLAMHRDIQHFQMIRRLRTWTEGLLILFPLVVAPPFFLAPILLRRRRLAIVRMPRNTSIIALTIWVGLLAAYSAFLLPGQIRHLGGPAIPLPFANVADQEPEPVDPP
jgi:hypothetical protein